MEGLIVIHLTGLGEGAVRRSPGSEIPGRVKLSGLDPGAVSMSVAVGGESFSFPR